MKHLVRLSFITLLCTISTFAVPQGVPRGVSSGTISPGTANSIPFYATTGTTLHPLSSITQGVLATNALGIPSITASPTIRTSVTTPQIYGGSLVGQELFITASSNGSPSTDRILFAAGGEIKLIVDDGGVFISQGAPGVAASGQLEIGPVEPQAGTSQIKLNGSGFLMSTPENGAIEYVSPTLYFTRSGVRQQFMIGTPSGTTTSFGTLSGTLVPGNGLTTDVNGNIVDTGSSPGSGTVNAGIAGQYTYYATSGTAVSGLASVNNAVATTNGSGVAVLSNTLPAIVQGNITSVGTITAGAWQGFSIAVPFGGTGLSTGTSGGIPYFSSSTTMASSAVLSANNPVIGGGAGVAPSSGTRSGNTTTFGTTSGAMTSGNCVSIDANGNLIAAGAACSTSSGSVSPGLINQMAWYAATGSTVSGLPTSSNGVLNTDGTGIPSITDSPFIGNSVTVPTVIGGVDPNDNLTLQSTSSNVPSGDFINFVTGGNTALTINGAGQSLFNFMIRAPSMAFVGVSSGAVTIQPNPGAAGTYTMTLPTTAGTSGQVLTSVGGGPVAMTWTTPVQAGTVNQIAWYNATGSSVSGLTTANNGILSTDGSGVPSISSTLPTAVQSNITSLGTITSGTWNGTTIDVPDGGTGVTSFTTNGVLFGNDVGAIQVTAAGPNGSILESAGGIPVFTQNPIINGSVTTPLVKGGTAVSSTLTLESTSGAGTSDSILFKTGSQVTRLTINSSGVVSASNTFSGVIGGTGATPAAGTFSSLTDTALATGCGTWTAGVAGTTGVSCGSGTVNSGTINQMAWYASTGTAVSGLTTANNGILATNGSGVPSISTSLPFTVPVSTGGTGDTTFTTNGVIYGNGTSALQATAQGGSETVLVANGGAPSFSASPIIRTSVTTPQIFGGNGPSSVLTIAATSSGSPSTDRVLMSAGGLVKLIVDDGGVYINQGVPGVNASSQLEIGAVGTSAGTSQIKLIGSGSLMTTPEDGAIEHVNPYLNFTVNSVRRTIQIGTSAAIPAATLSTSNTTVGSFSVVAGETYTVDITLNLTSSSNTAIIGFSGTNMNGETLTINQMGTGLISTGVGQLAANSASTVTCIGNALSIRILGEMSAASTGTFSVQVKTNTGTIPLLTGSYFKYTQL